MEEPDREKLRLRPQLLQPDLLQCRRKASSAMFHLVLSGATCILCQAIPHCSVSSPLHLLLSLPLFLVSVSRDVQLVVLYVHLLPYLLATCMSCPLPALYLTGQHDILDS